MKTAKPYALVRIRGLRKPARLQIPFTIGTSGEADIIANIAADAPFSYVVSGYGDELILYHTHTSKLVLINSIEHLGIGLIGMVQVKSASRWKKIWGETLATERFIFARLPKFLQKVLGKGLRQSQRLGLFVASVVLLTGLTAGFNHYQQLPVDRSREALPLKIGERQSGYITSKGNFRDYKRGVTFRIDNKSADKNDILLLVFDAGRINMQKELEIFVNGNSIGVVSAHPDCDMRYCPQEFRIAKEFLHSESDTIFFAHQPSDSEFSIRGVALYPLPEITEMELEKINLLYEEAIQAFAERDIAWVNLTRAEESAKNALKLLNRRAGSEEKKPKIQAMLAEISTTIAASAKELWNTYDRQFQLHQWDDAEKSLNNLLRLYPDSDSTEHLEIKKRLSFMKVNRK